jgi:hypothetical protein
MAFFRRLIRIRREGSGAAASPDAAFELAGFFAAHAVWCVSVGETLVPLGAWEDERGQRSLVRFTADRLEQGVEQGKEWLECNAAGAERAVLIYDGFVPVEGVRTDALIVDVRDHSLGRASLCVVPYRHAKDPKGFAVHKPKFSFRERPDEAEATQIGEAFFRGIAAHEKGAEVWNRSLDESK